VLVVDDEPDVVKSVQDLLRLDYEVLGATRAQDGLRIMQETEVHIVMTDQRMPEMTGVEFLRRLRGEHPEAIRLLFTGYADVKAVIDAINQGNVYRYISKPWDPDELQTIIRQAAEHYDLLVERKSLLAELQAKNRELEKANAELQEANQLKSLFIQVASHELRTPLMILLGLSELAARTGGLEPPLADWLQRITRAGERLKRLVDQMIKLLVKGRFDQALHRQPVDLRQLLAEAAEDVRPFVELRRQQLTLDLAPDLGQACVEADKIRDSIDHLLLNAIKFTPDGGRIELAARREPDGGAVVRISDTGVGIDPQSLPRIFDPFFTSYRTTSPNVARHSSGHFEFGRQGIGLGLSVVKLFVEMHGGRVEVASRPGQGTTVTVTLPPAP
jgi:signal transduction histidine kinase